MILYLPDAAVSRTLWLPPIRDLAHKVGLRVNYSVVTRHQSHSIHPLQWENHTKYNAQHQWSLSLPFESPTSAVNFMIIGIIYNYPSKGRWIVVDIYRDAKRRGIYPPLFTDPEGDSCFIIYQIRWIKKCCFNFFFWNFRETTRHFSFRPQNSE